jgi:hypothetical protein
LLTDTIAAISLHIKRAAAAREQILQFESLSTNIFNDFEKIKTVDAFIFRFIKTQDLIGEKLFKEYLDRVGDYKDSMSMLDVLHKLEKLEIIESAAKWMIFRNLRNSLTHEYPDNEEEIIQGIKVALDVFSEMDRIYHVIVSRTQSNKL